MRSITGRAAALLFGSGFSALLYQNAWQREFRLLFGASTAASAAVLAVFLGGLGVGGLLLSRRVDASLRPLAFYGNLELGVAASAAVSPLLLDVCSKLYLTAGGATNLGGVGSAIARLALVALAVGPSVILMGGTLPAAARAVENDGDRARRHLALLYGANTLGAVAGTLLGTFALFEVFGTRTTLLLAVLVNVLVGLIARALARSIEPIPRRSEAQEIEGAPRRAATPSWRSVTVLAVGALAGFSFLMLEIVWYRALAPLLGGTTYTFGLVLGVALAGIGIGGAAYAFRSAERPAVLSELAVVTTLEAVLVLVPVALGDHIAAWVVLTRPVALLGFGALTTSWLLVALLVVFPAAVASGYQFPLLLSALGEGREGVGRHVARLYAANTAGSIAGSLIGGFVALPRLGMTGTWKAAAAVLLAAAGGVALLAASTERRRALPRLAVCSLFAALGALLLGSAGPTAVWRHQPIGAGRVQLPGQTPNALRDWQVGVRARLIWEADGVESTVGILASNGLAFLVGGKSDGAVFQDRGTQVMAGLVTALLHPRPRRAFVVGLGTGMTAGWLSRVPGMDRVDVAELEPAIVRVAELAGAANHAVLGRSNVTIRYGDGREMLLTTRDRYDLVLSEPSNPYRAGVAALYTQEFYRAVAEKLGPGGLFGQWVQGYEIDTETVRVILRTLRSVLPNVTAWQTQHGDILLVASHRPLSLDADVLRRRVLQEPFASALARAWLVSDLEGVLAHFLADERAVARVAEAPGVEIATDDRNPLEFAFARALDSDPVDIPLLLLRASLASGSDRPPIAGAVDWDRVAELRPRGWLTYQAVPPALPMPSAGARARAEAVVAACGGDAARARLGEAPAVERLDPIELFATAQILAEAGDDRAGAFIRALSDRGFTPEAALADARLHARRSDFAGAVERLLETFALLRREPLPLCNTADDAIRVARGVATRAPPLAKILAGGLLAGPFAVRLAETARTEAAFDLALAAKDPELCVLALGRNVEAARWNGPFLEQRWQCLRDAGHPAAVLAREDWARYLAATPGTF